MMRLLILTVALILGANCARHSNSQTSNAGLGQNTPTPLRTTPPPADSSSDVTKESEDKKEVPPEFRGIDFQNLAYPTSWRRKSILLKDGSREYEDRKYLGHDRFDFQDVSYVDLTGDEKKEAIVQLSWLTCGASCDGGAYLFYFYAMKRGRLKLLSRIETGSLGYDCGLKSFILSKQTLTLETFRSCRFSGLFFKGAYDTDERGGKFLTNRFTQFVLRFNGRRFVLRKRQVFPYPEGDFRGYQPKVSISND